MRESDLSAFYKCIGNNIRTLRKIKKFKVKELAERVSISDGALRNIESGAAISLPTLIDVMNALEVSPDVILHDYTYTKRKDINSPTDLELFIEVYNKCSDIERDLLMRVICAFLTHD